MTYRQLKFIIFSVLSVYVLMGLVTKILDREIYPFWSWDLFSTIPNTLTEYSLVFTAIDSKDLSVPVFFHNAKEGFFRNNTSPPINFNIIQALGRAIESGNSQDALRFRTTLEDNFAISGVAYNITKITYNPLEYWREHRIEAQKLIGHFTKQ